MGQGQGETAMRYLASLTLSPLSSSMNTGPSLKALILVLGGDLRLGRMAELSRSHSGTCWIVARAADESDRRIDPPDESSLIFP